MMMIAADRIAGHDQGVWLNQSKPSRSGIAWNGEYMRVKPIGCPLSGEPAMPMIRRIDQNR